MKLKELLNQLKSSELSRHSLGKHIVKGSLEASDLQDVICMLNLGILDLYTQFHLKTEQVIVQLDHLITRYELAYKNCRTNPDSLTKYVVDSQFYPFHEDRLVKIIETTDEIGRTNFLDDSNQFYSVNIISKNVIQIPYPENENAISVVYQAKPMPLEYECSNLTGSTLPPCEAILDQDIEIDSSIMSALLYFVGSRVHINLTDNATMVEANFYKNKYLEQVRDLKIQGIGMDYNRTVDVREEGWE